ncbi:MAG: hypothetical protein D6702_12740, partial [Planctomycetota bacterium]
MTAPSASELAALRLDRSTLLEVRDTFRARLEAVLSGADDEIAALPAWLPPPPPGLAGQALVVDAGGSNVRAAWVELPAGGGGLVRHAGPVHAELPRDVDAGGLFAFQAELAAELGPPPGLPVGYCFSYPSDCRPDGDAVLRRWTKGVAIPGVEGRPVGAPLRAALADRGLRPGPVRVLNDAVAALLAAAWTAGAESECVGLIVGTGSNMAAFLRRPPDREARAVNLESGNFRPP